MYSERIHNAVMFATKAHTGQTRKGNDIPYIYHPMEALFSLNSKNAQYIVSFVRSFLFSLLK